VNTAVFPNFEVLYIRPANLADLLRQAPQDLPKHGRTHLADLSLICDKGNQQKGACKVADRGTIRFHNAPPVKDLFAHGVCIKQLVQVTGLSKPSPLDERNTLYSEYRNILWASALLSATFNFMDSTHITRGSPPPSLCKRPLVFVEAALVMGMHEGRAKTFLIEQWVENNDDHSSSE
jgi:hypothetical protein